MPSILCIGRDPHLLGTRVALLGLTGAEVVASGVRDATGIIDKRDFDLIVLCHSVSLSEAILIRKAALLHTPTTHFLRLVQFWGGGTYADTDGFDAIVDAEPGALLRTVCALLENRPAQKPPGREAIPGLMPTQKCRP